MTVTTLQTDVLVVGAGPVGLVLATDLAQRGVKVIVVERRHKGEPPSVKCNHVAARSMEIFRRLGVVQRVRDAGLPADYPNDVAYRTSFLGIELTRIPIPCRADRYTATNGPDTWWPTPEPPHRINQIYLEPILFDHLAAQPNVQILSRTALIDFDQTDDGVITQVKRLDDGSDVTITSRYMVGCDGGASMVRKGIGATLSGDPVLQRVQSTYIRAPALRAMLERQGGVPAWATFSLNPRQPGNVYAIDGETTWLVHAYLRDGIEDFEVLDRDEAIRTILGVDLSFSYETLSKEDWIGRRLMADRFRLGRVFICGDASHLWVPYAGYGMNAGIADATNLAWLLGSVVCGWADPRILDVYEAERMPITGQVSHFAMNHAVEMNKTRRTIPANIEAATPEAAAIRASMGKAAYELNVQQYCCAGLNFGYFYDQSPVIAYDGEDAPPYTMGSFTPSTAPGARLPHFWLAPDHSLYDALGPYYTLLRFCADIDVEPLMSAARASHVPIVLLDVDLHDVPDAYQHKLVLARSDYHVAWRGNDPPTDVEHLINLLRGSRS